MQLPLKQSTYALISLLAIILLLSSPVTGTALTINNDTASEATQFIREEFSLEIPQHKKELSTTTLHERKNTKEREVIITIQEPASIWKEAGNMRQEQASTLKKAMKEYVLEELATTRKHYDFTSINGFSTRVTQEEYDALIKNPLVATIEEDLIVKTMLHNSTMIIGAVDAWDYAVQQEPLTGKGMVACIIDTGINYEHEAFGGWGTKIIGGQRFLYDDEPIDCNEDNSACYDDTDDKHGTHVAGIITANNTLRGVAPETSIVVVKALGDTKTGSMTNIIRGIEWCTEHKDTYNISVISMSIGTIMTYDDYCDNETAILSEMSAVINNATAQGIVVVSATGNDNNQEMIPAPACIKNTVRVASTDKDDQVSSFTNTWDNDLFLAPGNSIRSTIDDDNYGYKSGTSMATPHVAGALLILQQYYLLQEGTINNTKILALLERTGKPVTRGSNTFMRISIREALENITSLGMRIHSPEEKYYTSDNILINISSAHEGANITIKTGNESDAYNEPINKTFNEGNNTLTIISARDGVSNTKSVTFAIDTTPPSITIATPENNKTYNRYEQTINITAQDENGITTTNYEWEGTNNTYHEPTNKTFNEGNNTITAWTRDKAGNRANKTITFTIRTIPPNITSLSVNKAVVRSEENITVTMNITNDTAITSLQLNTKHYDPPLTARHIINATADNLGCAGLEGECTIQATIKDENGHEATSNTTIIVDDHEPRIINFGTSKTITRSDENLTIMITYEEPYLRNKTINGRELQGDTMNTTPEALGCAQGPCEMTLRLEDEAGNEANETIIIIIDDEQPNITIATPENNKTYNDAVPLIINATDNHEINRTWYEIRGNTTNYTTPVNITLEEGNNTITAWTQDGAGNKANHTITIRIDVTPPSITIATPENNKTYNKKELPLNITAQDENGITTISYEWEGTNNTYHQPTNKTFNEGNNTITAWTRDKAGNEANITITFTITLPEEEIVTTSTTSKKTSTKKPSGSSRATIIPEPTTQNTTVQVEEPEEETKEETEEQEKPATIETQPQNMITPFIIFDNETVRQTTPEETTHKTVLDSIPRAAGILLVILLASTILYARSRKKTTRKKKR